MESPTIKKKYNSMTDIGILVVRICMVYGITNDDKQENECSFCLFATVTIFIKYKYKYLYLNYLILLRIFYYIK